MNRRSFIGKIVQGGTVVATGLPEKLLSSEANTVDKVPFEMRMCDSLAITAFADVLLMMMRGWPKILDYHFHVSMMNKIMFMSENQCLPKWSGDSDYCYARFSIIDPDGEMRIDDRRLFVHKKYFLVSLD